jgi:hypothetical protein
MWVENVEVPRQHVGGRESLRPARAGAVVVVAATGQPPVQVVVQDVALLLVAAFPPTTRVTFFANSHAHRPHTRTTQPTVHPHRHARARTRHRRTPSAGQLVARWGAHTPSCQPVPAQTLEPRAAAGAPIYCCCAQNPPKAPTKSCHQTNPGAPPPLAAHVGTQTSMITRPVCGTDTTHDSTQPPHASPHCHLAAGRWPPWTRAASTGITTSSTATHLTW